MQRKTRKANHTLHNLISALQNQFLIKIISEPTRAPLTGKMALSKNYNEQQTWRNSRSENRALLPLLAVSYGLYGLFWYGPAARKSRLSQNRHSADPHVRPCCTVLLLYGIRMDACNYTDLTVQPVLLDSAALSSSLISASNLLANAGKSDLDFPHLLTLCE